MSGSGADEPPVEAAGTERAPTRRTVLALGAIAASTVVTVRPALAQTAGSVLNCQIPVPSPQMGGNPIAMAGTVVRAGTAAAGGPARRPRRASGPQRPAPGPAAASGRQPRRDGRDGGACRDARRGGAGAAAADRGRG